MKHVYAFATAAIICVLFTGLCLGQAAPDKKSYTFHGKVEAVDERAKSLKVSGKEVKEWMAAGTMDYKVDDNSILKKVKTGDQIMATVYDGDLVLHKVQVMPKTDRDSRSKK
jgi:Cu/Ag efflux protein CusF